MAAAITINVRNNSPVLQRFFFFQKPAIYTGGQQVYTNSLYTQALLPYATSGAVLTFSMILQFYAGVQQQVSPPVVGGPSGQLAASQPIGLTPAGSGTPTSNTTSMSVNPSLGLSVPVSTSGPQAGCYRIITPIFNPVLTKYNAGSAVQTVSGGILLSSFVTAQPNSNLDCQPGVIFYVQTGIYAQGMVIDFTSSAATAAICDATPGFTAFEVHYNADGTWSVTPFALVHTLQGGLRLIEGAATANAEILNEAGTAVLSKGYVAVEDFNFPFTVQNLSQSAAISLFGVYQVGPPGGPYVGSICTAKSGTCATFSGGLLGVPPRLAAWP